MAKITPQMKLWISDFGRGYTGRNTYGPAALDRFYKKLWGTSLTEMNRHLLGKLKIGSVLEVGCNIGMKLNHLQKQGYKNLYGIELQWDAVERAKRAAKNINIIQGSAFDIPFKENYFDLVFTNGVLIHIHPKDLEAAMREIYRCSKKYISGLEYFSETLEEVPYHQEKHALWKNDFAGLFRKRFPSLKLLKEKKYYHLDGTGACDSAYLFKK